MLFLHQKREKDMCSCFQNTCAIPTLLIFRFSQNCLASGLFTNLNILRGNNEFSLWVHLEKLRNCDEALKTLWLWRPCMMFSTLSLSPFASIQRKETKKSDVLCLRWFFCIFSQEFVPDCVCVCFEFVCIFHERTCMCVVAHIFKSTATENCS